MEFRRISVEQARALLDAAPANGLQIVDVRDEQSYTSSHIDGAVHLDNASVQEFLLQANRENPLLIYCYHGNMSQGAAAYFAEQGFDEAYSLDGGFEAWEAGQV